MFQKIVIWLQIFEQILWAWGKCTSTKIIWKVQILNIFAYLSDIILVQKTGGITYISSPCTIIWSYSRFSDT